MDDERYLHGMVLADREMLRDTRAQLAVLMAEVSMLRGEVQRLNKLLEEHEKYINELFY